MAPNRRMRTLHSIIIQISSEIVVCGRKLHKLASNIVIYSCLSIACRNLSQNTTIKKNETVIYAFECKCEMFISGDKELITVYFY